MKQRVKLLLAIPHLGGGGAERVIATLARRLDPQRFEIHLVLLTQDGPGAEPLPAWVTVHRFHASRVRFAWLPLLRLIRAERPEVILSGMAHLSFMLLLLKPFFPRGTAVFVRQNTTASAAASLLSHLGYRFLYRRANRIICQSQGMAGDLAHNFSIAAEKLTVLANPIDVEAIQAVQVIQAASAAHSGNEPNSTPESHDSAPHLLCIGRLSPEKGVDLLLRALPEVKAVYPNVHLTILGIGSAAESLHQLSIQLGLENEVTFAGYADPAAFYTTVMLFVLPSRYEGMPNALLEAAAAGLPIVATPCCAGVTSLLRDAPGAWVTPAIDSEALAQTLLTALAELGKSPLGNSPNRRPRFDHAFLTPFELRTAVAAYASLLAPLAPPTPMARSLALLIPTIDQIGGAERQVLLLAKELAARGWRVSVIALSGNGQAAAQELASANVDFLSLQMRKAWVDPRGWHRYLAWFRANRPEVVHAHLPHATWFARWVHLLAPARLLVDTIHTSKTTGASGGPGRSLGYRLSSGLTDQTTCVSQAVADAALRAGLARREMLKVIPNGVLLPPPNPSSAARNPSHAFQWIAVGRLAPVKDYPTLLRAFAGLPGQPRLQIVGSGPEEARLRALAARLQIQTRVYFAGFQADVQPLLEAADAFVLASLWEGLPVSVLEGSATSLPVVATDAAGTSEAMIPGETGYLVPIGDPDALTAAMTRIMTLRPAQRLRMGANGRRFVEERYSLAKIADQWEQLYTQLLRNHQTPREEAETRPTTKPAFAAAAAPGESASSSAGETSCP